MMTAFAAAALVALFALAVMWIRERRGRRAALASGAQLARRLDAVAGAAQEAIAVFGRDHSPDLVNPAFRRLTGYDAAALHGQPPLPFTLPEDRPPLLADLEALAADPAPRLRECRLLTREGDTRWCRVALAPAGEGGGYILAVSDRTAERAAEERLRHDAELLAAVIDVQQAVAAAGLDADAVMHVIAERCRELTRADGAAVLLRSGDRLIVRASAVGVGMPDLPLQGSLAGQAVRANEVVVSRDVTRDAAADRSAWEPFEVRSLAAAPLVHGGAAVGAVQVVSRLPGAFSEEDARALRHLSGLLGAALAHASAFEARQQRLEERTRALQESEQRFKQLVDTAQEGIWVLDERGVGTYVNPRLAELFGYPAGEMLGRRMFEFMDPAGRAEAQPKLDAPEGGPVRTDLRFRRRDGGDLWTLAALNPIVDRDGAPVGTVVMLSDITDRKRAEDRLLHSAERLRTLHEIHHAVLGAGSTAEVARAALVRLSRLVPCRRCTVALFDDAAGEARVVAGLAGGVPLPEERVPLADLSPDDTLRRGTIRSVDDIAALESRPPMFDRLLAEGVQSVVSVPLLAGGTTIGELNIGMPVPGGLAPDHRDIAVEVAAPLAVAIQHAHLRDELARRTGELERRIGALTDALRRAGSDTEAIHAALGRDLREPLRQMQGFARLLLEEHGEALDPEARLCAVRITEAGRELAGLVEGMSRLARAMRHDLLVRTVALDTVVDEVVRDAQARMNGRAVAWDIERLPLVTGDPALLRDAVRELVDNAIRFTAQRPQARIAIRPIASGEEAGLAIEDNGTGFPPDQAGRLFRPFERLHPNGTAGHGLGLALVASVAERHRGRVWAESLPGVGATFYFALPARPAPDRAGR